MMEPVETVSLVLAIWLLGMFLGFWLATHGNRYWRMALVGSADGVPLRRSWRLVIVYAQYLMFNIAISITFLVLAAISQVVAVHATTSSGESIARLMVYVMVVGGVAALVWGAVGVRYLRRTINKDAARAST
ncbi:MAG: hypothetical protein AAF500_16460 [Myxococcota bacterium]